MKKAASILVLTVLLLTGMVLPSFAYPETPLSYTTQIVVEYNGYTYLYISPEYVVFVNNSLRTRHYNSEGKLYALENGIWNYLYDTALTNFTTIKQTNRNIYYGSSWTGTQYDETSNIYFAKNTIDLFVGYSWGVDSGFNCENSYAQFRTFSLDLTVNTQGYQDGELTFKQYVQRQTSNGWATLNVESPVSIKTNQGIGKSNIIPLWSIVPFKTGTYRYIVNAYKNGVIVSGGSTYKQFELTTAPTWTTVTTGSAVTMGQLTITPVAERPVQILSPDDESSWTDEVHVMLGVFGVKNGSIHVQGIDETSVVLWTINPSDTSDYTGVPYQLNGIRGDTYFTCDKPLPAGNGECFVYVTGGSSSQVETPYYQVEEDGRWWHVIDIVKIYTKPTVESGRGSDYWWDKDSGNYIEDPFDLDKIVDSVTNFVGGFAGFFTFVQASITYIPASIFGLGVFGATMSLILVLFRRA